MSQAAATNTTPHKTVVYYSGSSPTMTVVMAPTLIGLPVTLGQHNVVLPLLLMLRDTSAVVDLAVVPHQQLQSQMPS